MKKSKEEVYSIIRKQSDKVLLNRSKKPASELNMEIHKETNIPNSIIFDYMTGRVSVENANEYILYVLMSHLCPQKLEQYFTDIEIRDYKKTKYEIKTIDLPVKIPCMQVFSDQWIGVTDVNFIMDLVNAQKIRYNTNAQRVMTRIVQGENQYWAITQNKQAIKEIAELYHNNSYIPDTLTFNFPDDANNSYYYDDKKNELVINELQCLDITDGYHRYRAMQEEKERNPKFNYPVIIQFVSFSDDKSKQMIFQMDQKTQMKKVDSDSMNMNDPANIVLERLNTDIKFLLKGEISRNEGMINFPLFANALRAYYFNEKKKYSSKEIIEIENKIRDIINYIYEEYPEIFPKLDSTFTFMSLIRLTLDDIQIENIDKVIFDTYFNEINTVKYEKKFNYVSSARASFKNAIESIVNEVIKTK